MRLLFWLVPLAVGVGVGLIVSAASAFVAAGAAVAVAAVLATVMSDRALFLTVLVGKAFVDMLWFASVSVGPLSLNPQSLLSVWVLVLSLSGLALRRIAIAERLALPMLAFVGVNVYAMLVTPSMADGLSMFLRVVSALPLVFIVPALVPQLGDPRTSLRLFIAVMGVVYASVLLQPLGVLPYTSYDGNVARATGFYYHPWDVARYVAVATPLLLLMLSDFSLGALERLAYRVVIAMGVVVAFFTYLKMAWVVVSLEFAIWFVWVGRIRAFLLVIACAAVVLGVFSSSRVVEVVSDVPLLWTGGQQEQALSGRVHLWEEAWQDIEAMRPIEMLLGYGYEPPSVARTGFDVHNDYLRLVVMNGIMGLLTYSAVIAVALVSVLGALRRMRAAGNRDWLLGVAVTCIFGAYLVMGITADVSTYPVMTTYLWLLTGLVLGLARSDRTKRLT